MSSGPELEQFLAQLGERRERVLKLAGPTGVPADDLLAELNELSQQLIVADEELRVQQEELERARGALAAIGARRDLLDQPHQPSALTDRRGVVVGSTPGLQRLIRQPAARLAPRPIATWFEVGDRSTVRGMIGRIGMVGERRHADLLQIKTGDGGLIPVRVGVEGVADPIDGQLLLRWELEPVAARHLWAVPGPPELVTATVGRPELPLQLADAAVQLYSCTDTDEVLAQIVAVALRLVPEADDAGVIERLGRPVPGPRGVVGGMAGAADAAQVSGGSGPAMRAFASLEPVRQPELSAESWLQNLPLSDADRPGAALAVPMVIRGRAVCVLTLYATRSGSLDRQSEVVATALAEHAALALRRIMETGDLSRAVQTRQLVAQAVGVLIERHRLTPGAAFDALVSRSRRDNLDLLDIARRVVDTAHEPGLSPSP